MDVASRVFRLIQLEGDWYWRLDIKNDDGLSARSCPGRRRRKTPRRRWELQRAGTDGCVCPRTKGRRCLFALRRSVGPACKRNWPRPAQVALVPPPRSRKAPLRRASLKVGHLEGRGDEAPSAWRNAPDVPLSADHISGPSRRILRSAPPSDARLLSHQLAASEKVSSPDRSERDQGDEDRRHHGGEIAH
jgi:hypothetical protein